MWNDLAQFLSLTSYYHHQENEEEEEDETLKALMPEEIDSVCNIRERNSVTHRLKGKK